MVYHSSPRGWHIAVASNLDLDTNVDFDTTSYIIFWSFFSRKRKRININSKYVSVNVLRHLYISTSCSQAFAIYNASFDGRGSKRKEEVSPSQRYNEEYT
jgi:hypothetical protein